MFTIGSLLLLVLCALWGASSGLELDESYIRMPLKEEDKKGGKFDNYLIQALELNADSDPASVLNQLKRIANSANNKRSELDIAKAVNLRELSTSDRECSSDLNHYFLVAYQAYKSTDKSNHPEAMMGFLEAYGQRKYPLCVPDALESLERDMRVFHLRLVRSEEFFRLALSKEGVQDALFHEALKHFRPLESRYDVNKLAPVSERTGAHERQSAAKNQFDRACEHVYAVAYPSLITLNLADHFVPDAKNLVGDLRLAKLNEMNRICNEAYGNDALLKHLKKVC